MKKENKNYTKEQSLSCNENYTKEPSLKIIGIAGGIGSGKSAVTKYLRKCGFIVVDADEISHEVTAAGHPSLNEIAEEFGAETLRADGSLDRKKLARIVFNDKDKLGKLNSILHGYITSEVDIKLEEAVLDRGEKAVSNRDEKAVSGCTDDQVSECEKQSISECGKNAVSCCTDDQVSECGNNMTQVLNNKAVFLVAPLFFEAEYEKKCGEVWVIVASRENRLKRAIGRDGVKANDIKLRMDKQITDEELKTRGDVIIKNDGTIKELKKRIDELITKLDQNT